MHFNDLIPWEPSVTLVAAIAVTVLFYVRGCLHIPASSLRKFCFWLGLISLYSVSHTGFDYYSEHAFFMHRIQHSVLHHLSPFLIALSRPGAALAAGMPARWPAKLRSLLHWQPVSDMIALMNNVIIAPVLFCGLIAFWLIAPIHFIAMLDWRLYRLMNWGMMLNGLMFWNLVLNNYALRPATFSAGARIAMMLAIIPPQIVIGTLIFLNPHELYPLYTMCGRAFSGMTPMEDQQIGGLILWIPAAMMSVTGILTVIQREWLNRNSA